MPIMKIYSNLYFKMTYRIFIVDNIDVVLSKIARGFLPSVGASDENENHSQTAG